MFVSTSLVITSIFLLSTSCRVSAIVLSENETVLDDFDTGQPNYWKPKEEAINTTVWFLSKYDDPPPFGIVGLRPPKLENDVGFIELVPLSNSPSALSTLNFELLPDASVELVYWNAASVDSIRRKTSLILFTDFADTGESKLVYSAPIPEKSYPDWITVQQSLKLSDPSNVTLRITGFRVAESDTGLAVSKITIKNGANVITTTLSPTTLSTTEATEDTTLVSTVTSITTQSSANTPEPSTPTSIATELSSTSTTSSSTTSEQASTDTSLESTGTTISTSSSVTPTTASSTTTSQITTLSSLPTDTSTSSISSSVSSSSFVPSLATSSTPGYSTDSTSSSSTTPLSNTTKTSTKPVTSTAQPPTEENNSQTIGIAVGVSLLLLILLISSFALWYRQHRRRKYLIEERKLVTGSIRKLEQSEDMYGVATSKPTFSPNVTIIPNRVPSSSSSEFSRASTANFTHESEPSKVSSISHDGSLPPYSN